MHCLRVLSSSVTIGRRCDLQQSHGHLKTRWYSLVVLRDRLLADLTVKTIPANIGRDKEARISLMRRTDNLAGIVVNNHELTKEF